jgi:hypothetical protein
MGKILYLLKEETKQEDTLTKTKYLYKSILNKEMVRLMDYMGYRYFYVSTTYGILEPDVEIEPYQKKILNLGARKTWVAVVAELLSRYCRENKISTITFMFAGDKFLDLQNSLENYGFYINQPMKHFRTKHMQVKWVYTEIRKRLLQRLSEITS